MFPEAREGMGGSKRCVYRYLGHMSLPGERPPSAGADSSRRSSTRNLQSGLRGNMCRCVLLGFGAGPIIVPSLSPPPLLYTCFHSCSPYVAADVHLV
jgi:hypothetical protein